MWKKELGVRWWKKLSLSSLLLLLFLFAITFLFISIGHQKLVHVWFGFPFSLWESPALPWCRRDLVVWFIMSFFFFFSVSSLPWGCTVSSSYLCYWTGSWQSVFFARWIFVFVFFFFSLFASLFRETKRQKMMKTIILLPLMPLVYTGNDDDDDDDDDNLWQI